MIYTYLPFDTYFLDKFKSPEFHSDLVYKQSQTIVIGDAHIKGCSKRIDFEPGLYIQLLDIYFLENVSFTKMTSLLSTTEKWYLNAYFIEPAKASFNLVGNDEDRIIELKDNILFMPEPNCSNLQFCTGSTIKCIVIVFSTDWLHRQLNGNESMYRFNISWLKQDASFPVIRKLSTYELFHINDFFKHAFAATSTFLIKGYTYYFIHRLFDYILNYRRNFETYKPHSNYEELVAEVENKIIQSIRTQIPCIKELAKECYLSESTLKRYFKKVFGKNIYEYYLTKKMELAHELLAEQGWSVTKITIFLGYKSNSHFSTLFKKIYGYVPSKAAKKAMELAATNNL